MSCNTHPASNAIWTSAFLVKDAATIVLLPRGRNHHHHQQQQDPSIETGRIPLFCSVPSSTSSRVQQLLLNTTAATLILTSAAAWLPAYAAVELIFIFLDPSHPPRTFPRLFGGLFSVLAGAMPVLNATFAWAIVVILNVTKQPSAAVYTALADQRKVAMPAMRDCTSTGNLNQLRSTTRQWMGVFTFLMLFSMVVSLFLALLGYLMLFAPTGRLAARIFSAVVVAGMLFLINATCMTIPTLLRENNNNNAGVLAAIKRSMDLTLHSTRSFLFPIITYIILNAVWIAPLAVFWPNPAVLLFVTWMATGWNIALLNVLWDCLVVDYASSMGTIHQQPSDSASISKPKKRLDSFSNRAILFALSASLCLVVRLLHQLFASSLPLYLQPPVVLYSPARKDRSGAQSLEMMLHDAYAFHHGATYGGSCAVGNLTEQNLQAEALFESLGSLGVQKILKFSCPPREVNHPSIPPWYPWIVAKQIVTSDWLDHVHSQLTYPEKSNSNTFAIVAHVRRGDITPCTDDKVHRYLPNSFYLETIEKYISLHATLPEHRHKTVEVTIHTSDTSFESMDVFRERNFTVKHGGNIKLADVWLDFIMADVLIMSPSSFSIAPALLKRDGVVVFPPFLFFEAAPGWISVDRRDMERYQQETVGFCDSEKKTQNRRDGNSGVWFLLRNFGVPSPAYFYT